MQSTNVPKLEPVVQQLLLFPFFGFKAVFNWDSRDIQNMQRDRYFGIKRECYQYETKGKE